MDVNDDPLATVLEALSHETHWRIFEGALNQHVLRVYDLEPACVRLDSTTANGPWTVTDDGLFQYGDSKDHRPDLPQVKVRDIGPGSPGHAGGDRRRAWPAGR